MAANWVEKGWVSVRDLAHLGWSDQAIGKLKQAVPEQLTGIPELGKARELEAVNSWAQDNGQSSVTVAGLKAPKVSASVIDLSARRAARGTHPQSKAKPRARSQAPQPTLGSGAGYTPLPVTPSYSTNWFPSKKAANAAGYLAAKDLHARLWTENLIVELLQEPQAHGENFHNSSAPIRYWEKSLVLNVEASEAFGDHMGRSLKRRKISWEDTLSAVAQSNLKHGFPSAMHILNWTSLLEGRLSD